MTDDTREKREKEPRRRVPPFERRLAATDATRRATGPTPFSHAMLRARLALLRPRPARLDVATTDDE